MRATPARLLVGLAVAAWPALHGCRGAAEAGPQHNPAIDADLPALAIPPSWQPLAVISNAVVASLESNGIRDAKVSAWGDPARGCYSITLAASVAGDRLPRVGAGLRKGFGAAPQDADAAIVVGGNGFVELNFELSAPTEGRMRAFLRDDGRVTRLVAAACFFHQRYPAQCRRHCEQLLPSLRLP